MNNLNHDIIYLISSYLQFNNILQLSIVNKYMNYIFDDKFFEYLSIFCYSENFWKLASRRPIKLSKPLKNFKQELIRIENFQRTLDNLNYQRWTQKDFYNYWNYEYNY